ncbi:hypothetical protein FC093_18355 [Ilyomonas limi]|uniref:Uncharacterized protein n=1 Tax=Ilyomonas limi TaxID=2575867 RepID=A0A4U3KXU2_9BACT|nr:hypothetical protein [Ilyomonas limi]TKK65966.1 hypothetical protein FC093_18355 [Ilyomonas limi]
MAKDAISLWREYLQKIQSINKSIHARLLTDITGRNYTIVLELSYTNYADLEPAKCLLTRQDGWKEFYQQFIPLCEFSERTQYKLEIDF